MENADLSSLMTTNPDSSAVVNALLGLGIGFIIFLVIFAIVATVLEIVGEWKTLKKAGEPGWVAIIPFANTFFLIKIAKLEWWYFLIFLALVFASSVDNDTVSGMAGLATLAFMFVVNIKIAKAFNRGAGLGVVCTLFPFIGYMILGYSSAEYQK